MIQTFLKTRPPPLPLGISGQSTDPNKNAGSELPKSYNRPSQEARRTYIRILELGT
jgi:hypothetical protein